MTIEERLEKVEKELTVAKRGNRWLLVGMALVIGIGLVTQAYGSKTEKQIRSNSFVLEDANGKGRAVLGIVKDKPTLVMLDEKGIARAQLGMNELGSGFALFDEKGMARAQLGMNMYGNPEMDLFNKKGKSQVVLSIGNTGAAGLILGDEEGRIVWSAP